MNEADEHPCPYEPGTGPFALWRTEFERAAGYLPTPDELGRFLCVQAGRTGHELCGTCPQHAEWLPRFICGHEFKREEP